MSYAEYSPARVLVTVNGGLISGFSEEMIEIDYVEDDFSEEVGALGDVVRVQNLNRMAELTISLLQTSPSNDFLAAMAFQGRHFGLGVGELQIKDLGSNVLVSAPFCWVKKQPSAAFGKAAKERQWVLRSANTEIYVGGALTLL